MNVKIWRRSFLTLPATASDSRALRLRLRRSLGIALRHVYLYRESWPRLIEMMYWPLINITLFGFISLSIVRRLGHADVMTDTFLGGLLLAEIMSRSVLAMLIMYMEEVWSRNLGHLFASPLQLGDYISGLILLNVFRCFLALTPAFIIVYYMFDFSILRLGWGLPLYAALLSLNGWWCGLLIISLILRFGQAAEWLAWMCTWLLMPFMAPYYPVSVLPPLFQAISWTLPGTYVFESMKIQLATGQVRLDYLGLAFFLNLVYFAGSGFILVRSFRSAKRNNGFLQMGE